MFISQCSARLYRKDLLELSLFLFHLIVGVSEATDETPALNGLKTFIGLQKAIVAAYFCVLDGACSARLPL